MLTKTRVLSACLFLILILTACQTVGDSDLVGRWEAENLNIAFEFNEDGSGVNFTSLDPYYPIVGIFTYTFDSSRGVLEIKTGEPEKILNFLVTFKSKDKISVEQRGMKTPVIYIRRALPELPAEARARIGGLMIGTEFTVIETKELESDWEEDYKTYTAIFRTSLDLTAGHELIAWLVTLKVTGQDQNRMYVLLKGEGRWGVIEMVKNE